MHPEPEWLGDSQREAYQPMISKLVEIFPEGIPYGAAIERIVELSGMERSSAQNFIRGLERHGLVDSKRKGHGRFRENIRLTPIGYEWLGGFRGD